MTLFNFLLVIGVYMKEKEGAQYLDTLDVSMACVLLVYYCSTKLTSRKGKFVDMFALAKFEASLHQYVYDLPLIALQGRFNTLYLYSDVFDFVNSNTVFDNLTLNSLRILFRALLLSKLLAFLLFLGIRLFHRPKKPPYRHSFVRANYDGKYERTRYERMRYMGRSDFHKMFYIKKHFFC